jgi:23S rRNA maturation-related 3'-5' exoribonuclease YhaM
MYNNIKEIQPGKMDDIIVLIKSINKVMMKSGAPYQKVIVRDLDGNECTFTQFDVMLDIELPMIAKVKVDCVEYGANLNMKIKECVAVDGYSMDKFLPKAHIDSKDCWKYIAKTLKTIRNSLSRVVCGVLNDDKNRYMTLPMNPTGAFARQSGILEATTKLVSLADRTAKLQSLDRDLLVSAAILYYIGNLDTIDEGYNFTSIDLMYGAELTAYTKVQFKAKELIEASEEARAEIKGEDVMMLAHILMCKNNKTTPAIPEASVLKYLDIMLREIDEMNESLLNGDPGSIVTDNNNYNKRLYKSTESQNVATTES